jgi:hypothetical protein
MENALGVNLKFAVAAAIAMTSCGCASTLQTFDSKKTEMAGVPVSVPVLVKITESVKYVPAPNAGTNESYCTPERNSRYAFMPLGERIYVNFDSAPFGKGEFKLEFNDSGLMKSVSLNSDATAGAEQISGLIGTILPYLSAPKSVADTRPTSMNVTDPDTAAAAGTEPAQALKDRYCLKAGTEVIDVVPVTPGATISR